MSCLKRSGAGMLRLPQYLEPGSAPLMKHAHPLPAGLILATVLALQACGGGGGGDGGDTAGASAGAAAGPAQDSGEDPVSGSDNDAQTSSADEGAGSDGVDTGSGSPQAGAAGAAAPVELTCGLPDFQAEALRLVNARRAAGASCGSRGSFPAAPALRWQAQLAEAAYGHSLDMATQNYFSHTSLDGQTLGDRVAATDYGGFSALGENIAAGYPSVEAVVQGWMDSPGHCANLMSRSYTEMALACARDSGSVYGIYWTQVLAKPR